MPKKAGKDGVALHLYAVVVTEGTTLALGLAAVPGADVTPKTRRRRRAGAIRNGYVAQT